MSTSCIISFFFSDDSKQDAANTTSHRKSFIELLKLKTLLTSALSTIWGNSDGCAKKYICASDVYFMSVMSQYYSILIDRGINASGNVNEVFDGINDISKQYIYQLMSNFQLLGSKKLIHRF